MSLTLIVRGNANDVSPQLGGITFDLPRVVVGRGEGCDLRLPDLSVSHRHASFRQRGSDYLVVDEGSTNGTHMGTVRLHPQSPRVVRSGERLRVGRVWIEVRIDHNVPTPHVNQATRELALALVAQALEAQGEYAGPLLRVIEGPDKDKKLPLDDSTRPMILGRGREADFMLDLNDASRRHAQVFRKADVCYVRDLGSRLGTFGPSVPISMEEDHPLRHGDTFSIGPDLFLYEHPASEALKELELADDAAFEAEPEALEPAPTNDPELIEQGQEPAPPVLERPRPVKKAEPQRGGWAATDILIFVLALVILGISGLGLIFLFKGG